MPAAQDLPMPGLSLQKSYLNITTSDLLLLAYKLTTMLHACGPLEIFGARLGGDGSFLRQRGGDQLMLSSCAGRDVGQGSTRNSGIQRLECGRVPASELAWKRGCFCTHQWCGKRLNVKVRSLVVADLECAAVHFLNGPHRS